MRKLWTIARFGFLEALRARFFLLVLIFGLVAVLTGALLGGVPWGDVDQVILSLGWGALYLMCMILAAVFLTMQIWRDRERRILYLVLARPVDRTTYLAGRWLSMVLLLAVAVSLGALSLWLGVTLFGIHPHGAADFLLPALWIWGKTSALAAYAIAFAALLNQLPALFATLSIYIVGSSTGTVLSFARQREDAFMLVVSKVLYYLVPNFGIFDLTDRVVHGIALPPVSLILWSVGYFLGYGMLTLLLFALVFERRDLS